MHNIEMLKTDKGEILTEQTQILNEFQKWYKEPSKQNLSDRTTPIEKIADIQLSYIEKYYLYLFETHLTIMKTSLDMKSGRLYRDFIKIAFQDLTVSPPVCINQL